MGRYSRRLDLRQRCTGLLVSLLLLPLLLFSLAAKPGAALVAGGAITAVLLGGIHAVSGSKRHLLVGVVLMLPALFVRWFGLATGIGSDALLMVPSLYDIIPLLFFVYVLCDYVFRSDQVRADHMRGAACIYLLLGMVWASVYLVLERWRPGSFRFPLADGEHYMGVYRELIYFSYVTLTTLGYGDSVPIAPLARAFALLESISGVLFVGILVARLAGVLGMSRPPIADD